MDPVSEKLLLTALGTAFGYAFKSGVDYTVHQLWRLRALRRFWGFLEEDTVAFVPTRPPGADEFGPAIGYGTGLALSEIQVLGKRLFPKMPEIKVTSDFEMINKLGSRHAIVLGGGKYNHAYLHLIDELRPALHFFDTRTQDFKDVRNAGRTVVYSPEYDGNEVRSDLGLIVHARRPPSGNTVLILAGSYTYGTWGAVRYLSVAKNVRPALKLLEPGFELVIRCAMDGNSVSMVTAESTLRRLGCGSLVK